MYFCYKIMLKEHCSGVPWEVFLELLRWYVLSAEPRSIGSDCANWQASLASMTCRCSIWSAQCFLKGGFFFFHIKRKSRFWTIWDLISLAPHVGRWRCCGQPPWRRWVFCRLPQPHGSKAPDLPSHLAGPSDTWVGKSWAGSLGFQDYNLWFCSVLCSEVLLRNTVITQNTEWETEPEVPQVRSRTMFGAVTSSRYSWWETESLAGCLSEAVLQPRQKTRNWALYTVSLLCAGLYRDDFISSAQDENNCTNNSKEA